MEIRSTRSFNAIPATIIRGVFNLYISNLLLKCIVNTLLIFFHLFLPFSLTSVNFLVANSYIHTYIPTHIHTYKAIFMLVS